MELPDDFLGEQEDQDVENEVEDCRRRLCRSPVSAGSRNITVPDALVRCAVELDHDERDDVVYDIDGAQDVASPPEGVSCRRRKDAVPLE